MATDINEKKDAIIDAEQKLDEYEQQEAYFLLVQIISHAQATHDKAQFDYDLSQWKKRFAHLLDSFSDEYKRKIKIMLSNEFLDTIIKNFSMYSEQSQKDYSIGLEKLHKIFNRAKNHKDSKKLDKDLDAFFNEYSLEIFRKKYPHIISALLSKSHRAQVLEKFDSSHAYAEFTNITEHPENYKDADDFKSAITALSTLYPTKDFNDRYKLQVESLLTTFLDDKKLAEIFTVDIDLSQGQVIPIEAHNLTLLNKQALNDFFVIVDKNSGDVDSLFNWICKYGKYINDFDSSTKETVVNHLMRKYYHEMPPSGTQYKIPKMDAGVDEFLTLSDFSSIDEIKKTTVLQLLGILSNGLSLTNDDIYRLATIDSNVQKAKEIEESKISEKVDLFIEDFLLETLTPSTYLTIEVTSDTSIDISVSEDVDITLEEKSSEIAIEDVTVHKEDSSSFKDTLKVSETFDKINLNNNTSSGTDSGSVTGGSSFSISQELASTAEISEDSYQEEADEKSDDVVLSPIFEPNISDDDTSTIEAIVLEEYDEKDEPFSAPIIEEETPNQPNFEDTIVVETINEFYTEPIEEISSYEEQSKEITEEDKDGVSANSEQVFETEPVADTVLDTEVTTAPEKPTLRERLFNLLPHKKQDDERDDR